MKESKYNFFYEFDLDSEKIIAYNSRTNALALMELNQYEMLNNYLRLDKPIEDEKFFSDLYKGGYLVDDKIEESELLRMKLLKSRFASKGLHLTIAPTLNCNFDCIYCYEKDVRVNSTMSEEVQTKILEMVKRNVDYIDELSVIWYGGEPLLALDVVESLSKSFIEICEKEKLKYSARIITNGYELSKDVAIRLKSLRIDEAQITLDGPPEIHNQRRYLIGGSPTFDEILNKLSDSADILRISLRINIDKENESKIAEITDIINKKGLKNKLDVYLGYTEPTNECYDVKTCLSYDEFSKLTFDFTQTLIKEEFIDKKALKYPNLLKNYCGADAENNYVIDPRGNLYKCWTDIGIDKYVIGNILGTKGEKESAVNSIHNFMLYDPTADEECKECKFLPICMGGCPRKRRDKVVDRCIEYKYTLPLYVKRIAENNYNAMIQESLAL